MATFQFDAKDQAGNTVTGTVDAVEARGAAAMLRDQGLLAMRIVPARASSGNGTTATVPPVAGSNPAMPGTSGLGDASMYESVRNQQIPPGAQIKKDIAPFLVSVPNTVLAVMYRQMATLMQAGVPMTQALTALTEQSANPRLKKILAECTAAVASGYTFSSVMERYPSVFNVLQIEMIRAGETSGLMDTMCNRIAAYLERDIEIKRKINRETLYPKIVLFVAGCVILLLSGLQAGLGSVYDKLRFAVFVALSIFAVFWVTRYANQYPAFGAIWDRIKMLVPGWGGVSRKYATARFTRALSTLYGGGVLLPRAVEISARACGNRAIGQQMLTNSQALFNGEGISGVFARSGLLSPVAVQMARTGEQTGSLDTMMDKVADYLEDEADVKAHQLAIYAGVAALTIAAMVVLYIAVSFYGGMFRSIMTEGSSQ